GRPPSPLAGLSPLPLVDHRHRRRRRSALHAVVSERAPAAIMDRGEDPALDPEELRRAANARFAANALDEALPLYSMAVEVARLRAEQRQQEGGQQEELEGKEGKEPDLVVHLCNRSACLYKMESHEDARDDAAEAVALSGGRNSKAFFRLARAQIALNEYDAALDTIGKAALFCEEELKKATDAGGGGLGDKDPLLLQKREFEKLLTVALRKKKQSALNPEPSPRDVKSIKLEPRTPSIKEFDRATKTSEKYDPLGEGNFSAVVVCRHKITKETFALKIIEKEECKKLAKRQHPNVYNEVAMERRILTRNRLPGHVNVIRCYHAMQDYGNLYFLMELHREHGDLWSKIRHRKRMVGCHSSLIRTYASELLAALEHCHAHGVVHRDVKPENVLLSERGGHVILIDFGTAKDLVRTDLNGPEFMGTPDFMSPEAVKEFEKGGDGCDFAADLWALGVVVYQLYAGALPFESQSPYLGFLKIQRGVYSRNMGVWDDDAWDLIDKLLKVNPEERLGAGCFEWVPPPKSNEVDSTKNKCDESTGFGNGKDATKSTGADAEKPLGKVVRRENGYDVIRQHPFFAKHEAALRKQTNSHLGADSEDSAPQPIPSLRDLAIRATAAFIDRSSLDVDLEDVHPPGDNSSYDTLRLKPSDRRRVMHLLDRLLLLKEPRNFRRFFQSKLDARLSRVRPESRDVMGLTQMNDKMGQFPGTGEDQPHPNEQVPASKLVGNTTTRIHHVTNPLFSKEINDECAGDEAQRKQYIKQLKESIRLVNRVRPSVVIACGYIDNSCRKLLSKINESVPVVLHDGASFFNFWVYGAHCVAMPLRFLKEAFDSDDHSRTEATSWFRMELEQIKTARSHGYVFVDGDPRDISSDWVAKMGKSHVLGVLGLCHVPVEEESGSIYESTFSVAEFESGEVGGQGKDANDDDTMSTSSSESDDSKAPPDTHVMHVVGRIKNGVRNITVQEEELVWETELLL
ncbi:hypothetical protein ACHAWF_014043, partial [Thalassiosira exigua]